VKFEVQTAVKLKTEVFWHKSLFPTVHTYWLFNYRGVFIFRENSPNQLSECSCPSQTSVKVYWTPWRNVPQEFKSELKSLYNSSYLKRIQNALPLYLLWLAVYGFNVIRSKITLCRTR